MEKMLSVIVSVYNEEAALGDFYAAAKRELLACAPEHEIIFVNDGSADRSLELIRKFADGDSHVRGVSFSRNFGHEAAMIAGIDHARGDIIICMDADLQHPVECIPQILAKFEEGYEIVNMVRTSNKDAGLVKNVTSSFFYRFINSISDTKMAENASDFFAVSARAAEVLRNEYRENNRFLRGFVQNIGFRRTTLEYKAADRVAGESKYSIRKLMRFSMETIVCFSDFPLKMGLYAGAIAILIGIAMAVYTIVTWITSGTPDGYATIVVLLCFMFAVLFFMIGIIGLYIAVMFREIKGRPVYIVEERINFTD